MTRVERERDYYRRRVDDLGGRLLRVQQDLSRARREVQRSRTAAELIRRASRLVGASHSEEELCVEFLRMVRKGMGVDRAMLLRREQEVFRAHHVLGYRPTEPPRFRPPASCPDFHVANSRSEEDLLTGGLRSCIGTPYLIWAYHHDSGWALLVGNAVEDARIKRRFQTADREIVESVLNVFVEIFERRETEVALRKSETKYRDIFELSPEAVLLLDSGGRILEANQRLCDWVGLDVDKVTGMDVWDLPRVCSKAAKRLRENFTRRMQGGRTEPYEVQLEKPVGAGRVVRVRERAIRNRDGEIYRDLLIMSDITDQKRTERQLQETLDELRRTQQAVVDQERHRALAQMASGIAHDFNNSLSMIHGFTDLLLRVPEKFNDEETARRYLRLIDKAASVAADTVSRMRKFYRPRGEEAHRPLDLNCLIEEAISMTEPQWKEQARARGAPVQVATDFQQVPPIEGSEAELHEMLTNLIFNAVDAMPDGGVLRFRTRKRGENLLLEVTDTGTGMAETQRARCLEPFFSTKGEAGSGLGLSTVHGVLKRHEGRIEVESAVGEGTTIRITLPWAQGREEPGGQPVVEGETADSLRVLVIEDSEHQQHLLSEYLGIDGHRTDVAGSGSEGLEKFRENLYDLVITDRAMPDMSGDKVTELIKSIAPSTPVIMLTGFGEVMEAAGETVEHVDVLLSKPATLDQVRQALSKAFEEASLGARS